LVTSSYPSPYPPHTPLDWMAWMSGKLGMQQSHMRKYQEYYDSEEKTLAFAQEKFKQEFGSLFNDWRDNFCSLVVDSLSERMRINGFRFGDNDKADKDAAEIWQRNFLDADSNAAHIDALVVGQSYLIVWADDDQNATITPQSGHDVVVQYKPGSRRDLLIGFKRFYDDWGTEHATLWTEKNVFTSQIGPTAQNWMTPVQAPNPLGVVPVVPVINRARLRRLEPYSELNPILPLQRAINKLSADSIVASEFSAYPQRLISGIEMPEDADGNAVAPIKSAIDRLLLFEDENVKWGQFEASDLGNYKTLIDMFVQHISTISRVPPHYFLVGGSNFPSGEALIAAEAGLVSKVRERMLYFGESWETAMRLAFKVKGDARSDEFSCETIWADPEYRSDSQRVDALVKLNVGLGVPQRQLQEDYGYTPAQMERFTAMAEEEHKLAMTRAKDLADATAPPVPPGGVAPASGNSAKAASAATKPSQGNAGNNNRKNATP
jgi:hypothetical protein